MKKILLFAALLGISATAVAVDWNYVDEVCVIGDVETGWNWKYGDTAPLLTKVEGTTNVYEGQVVLCTSPDDNGFKFIFKYNDKDAYDWAQCVWAAEANQVISLNTPIAVSEDGDGDKKFKNPFNTAPVKIRLDMGNHTVTFSEADEIYIVGPAARVGYKLDEAIALKNIGNNTFQLDTQLNGGWLEMADGWHACDFKFLAARNWSSSIVAPNAEDTADGYNGYFTNIDYCDAKPVGYLGDSKWRVEETHRYRITAALSLTDEQSLVIKPYYEHVTLVGNFGGDYNWNPKNMEGSKYELAKVAGEDDVWQWEGVFEAGTEFKFLVSSYDWDGFEIRATEANHSLTNLCNATELTWYQFEKRNDSDYKWYVEEKGDYRLTLYTDIRHFIFERLADGSASGIEAVEVEAAEPVYYNLQGIRVNNPSNGIFIKVHGNKSTKVIR